MGIEVRWGNEDKTLVYTLFTGEWDWYEFNACSSEIAQLFATVGHSVDVIMDMRDAKPLPTDFMIHAGQAKFYKLNVGTVVIVQSGAMLWGLSQIIQNRFVNPETCGETLRTSNIKQAVALIQRHRDAREKTRPDAQRVPGFLTQ